MNTGDLLLATGVPDDIAVVDAGASHTYSDLRSAAAKLAAELSSLGLPDGSRIGILGPNSFFWVAAYVAVLKLNLVAVPLPDKLTPDDLRRNTGAVQCEAIFVDRRCLRRFTPGLELSTVITDAALESDREPVWPAASDTDPDADAVLMFTSGTTAAPKAVRITHDNIRANAESIVEYLGLRAEDRALVILPFFYCYGASLLHTHLVLGARLVLCNSFAFPETAIDMLDAQGCTVLAGVPSSFQLLLRASSFATRALPTLRIVQQAGGKLSQPLVEELVAAQPGAQVFVMYGQTEATARLSYLPPEMLTQKMGSVGRGIPGVQLRVLRDDMTPVAVGEKGEIYATGPNIAPGYFADPEGTAAKFTAHGLRTGDLAVVDDDGYIFVVDRRDDFIKSWGYRVSSQEVEAAALRMRDLVSAAAIGVPDDEAGEAVTLFVTARPGADISADDVLAECRRNLAKHMVPSSVAIIDEMPLSANGKIAKNALRKLFSARVSS